MWKAGPVLILSGPELPAHCCIDSRWSINADQKIFQVVLAKSD